MTGPGRFVRLDRTGLLLVLLFCNTFGVGAFGPLLPEIGRAQSLPDWQLGLVASAFGFARMAAAMPVGALAARHLAATLMAAPIVLVLGLVLLVSAGPLPVLLAGRFLLGISHTLTMVGGLTAILVESRRTSASARLNMFEFAGMLGILGGLGLVAVIPPAWGWKVSLLVASTPALLPLLVIPALRRAFPEAPPRPAGATAAGEGMSRQREDTGVIALMFGAGMVFALAWSAVSGFVIPIRGTREFGLTRTGISWLLGMAQALDLIALIPVGRLADRVGHGLMLGVSSVLLGLGVLGVGLGPFPLFAVGCACLGLGLAGWMLPLGVIRDHTSAGRLAWRTGLYRVGVDSAIFLGPLFAGTLGPTGESVLLAIIGGAAVALGARLVVPQLR
ncbi:MAG TPA: MFS transporter [Candidatus Eisenbacteria bacterium]|nr:MFS transporter [Candidatus Eisenbacteria bacterium]